MKNILMKLTCAAWDGEIILTAGKISEQFVIGMNIEEDKINFNQDQFIFTKHKKIYNLQMPFLVKC